MVPDMSTAGRSFPYVSVVIPTRARRDMLRLCLESVLAQDYPQDRYEIIVVEDGTDDGEVVVAALAPKSSVPIRYFHLPRSGVAATRNVGLSKSSGDIVAYIDDDALAASDWLTQHVTTLLRDGTTGCGGRVSPAYPETVLESKVLPNGDLLWTGSNVEVPGFPEVENVAAGNMALWRKALIEIGGFDGAFSKRGVWREETDICVRLIARGHRLVNNSRAVVVHRAARWADPIDRVRFGAIWAMTRDDAYFRAKNFGWRGVAGAIRAAARDSGKRVVIGGANFALVIAHLAGWIPGAWRGLRKKDRALGTLDSQ
jgi:glycosyltransferase involved in cell wall biosynthesis